jgi:hypothetical protein
MRALIWASAIVTAGWLAGVALAAESENDSIPTAGESTAASKPKSSMPKKESKAPARDPVTAAFALPRGLKSLTANQQKAYEKLKTQYESALRDAIQQSKQATDGKEKNKAAGQVREIRAKVRAGLKDIVALGYQDAQSAMQQNMQGQGMQQNMQGRSMSGYGMRGGSGGCPGGRRQ